jgi:predicted nucleic acid-binding Zn ribbon protein
MASGCIIGECPVCGEHIYEDEWLLVDDVLIHEECRHKNKKHVRIMSDLQK